MRNESVAILGVRFGGEAVLGTVLRGYRGGGVPDVPAGVRESGASVRAVPGGLYVVPHR